MKKQFTGPWAIQQVKVYENVIRATRADILFQIMREMGCSREKSVGAIAISFDVSEATVERLLRASAEHQNLVSVYLGSSIQTENVIKGLCDEIAQGCPRQEEPLV